MIAWLGPGLTTQGTGAKLDSACRSWAQRPLEHRLDNQEHWSKALQCLPEHSSTAPGARLYRDDRSSVRRSLSWSEARQLRAQEQGSTGMTGAVLYDLLVGARLNN